MRRSPAGTTNGTVPMDWPEVAIGRYMDEPYWTVDTNCKIYKELLVRRGWQPYAYERPYWRFRLPKKALTIRSKAAVERQLTPEQRAKHLEQWKRTLGRRQNGG